MSIIQKLIGKFKNRNADSQPNRNADSQPTELPLDTLGASYFKYLINPNVVFIINGAQYKVGLGDKDFVLKKL